MVVPEGCRADLTWLATDVTRRAPRAACGWLAGGAAGGVMFPVARNALGREMLRAKELSITVPDIETVLRNSVSIFGVDEDDLPAAVARERSLR